LDDPFAAAFRDARLALTLADARRPGHPIVFVNDAFLAMAGCSREEAVGRDPLFLRGPDTDAGDVARLVAAVAKGEGLEVEILAYAKGGRPFWDRVALSPVRDAAGEVAFCLVSHQDVSESRLAAQALAADLAQRTALLQEVDHRVKNSLQIVTSLVLLKSRRVQDPGAQRALHGIAERISALSLVHRLLYRSDAAGRFDAAQLIEDLVDDLACGVDRERITVALDLRPALVSAGKAASLALLVNESVANALQHAFPDGRPGRLSVRAGPDGAVLSILVEDDGVGLSGEPPREAFGYTLIEILAKQLRAEIRREDAAPGTRIAIAVPLDADEINAQA